MEILPWSTESSSIKQKRESLKKEGTGEQLEEVLGASVIEDGIADATSQKPIAPEHRTGRVPEEFAETEDPTWGYCWRRPSVTAADLPASSAVHEPAQGTSSSSSDRRSVQEPAQGTSSSSEAWITACAAKKGSSDPWGKLEKGKLEKAFFD